MKIIIIALVIVVVCLVIAKALALIELDPNVESRVPSSKLWYVTVAGKGAHNGQDANNAWSIENINWAALKDGDLIKFER